jgi:tetratricopeptide (TPR) repeat protein
MHLLGLVEKDAGNLTVAADLLDRAAIIDPTDHEIAHNQGLLARQLGLFEGAEAAFRRAVSLKSDFSQANISLGRLLIDLGRWDEALTLYQDLIKAEPSSLPARYGLATAQLELGKAEAAERGFDTLIEEGHDRPEIRFMRSRARLELRRTDEGLEDLRLSHRNNPTPLTLKTLAGILWMKGDADALEGLLAEATSQPQLAVQAAEILRQRGTPEDALRAIDTAKSSFALPPDAYSVAAMAYVDIGDAESAVTAATACLDADPQNRIATGNLISALLMLGKADEAMQHIRPMRVAEPNGQHWIAYEATAYRLMGMPDYESLVDMERFVRPYELPIPDGFDSIETFNTQFIEALDRWQIYETHPLDQSLRFGVQTPRDLTSIDDPVIKAYIAALDTPIRQYMRDVGSADDHPLTQRNTGNYKIAGCWSVRLQGGGRHINHVHPHGWISSAYYAAVPKETLNGVSKAGCIKFGEPPFETVPPSPPQKWVRPKPGQLVLFPSFMWHGTEATVEGSTRITAPFDAVPV